MSQFCQNYLGTLITITQITFHSILRHHKSHFNGKEIIKLIMRNYIFHFAFAVKKKTCYSTGFFFNSSLIYFCEMQGFKINDFTPKTD